MRVNAWFGLTLGVIGLGTVWGCGDGRNQLSPSSPSALSSSRSPSPRSISLAHPNHLDSDGDGYEDPEQPGDMPPPGEPTSVPDPGQIPAPDATVPVQLTINITGSFGTGAFAPNPLQAATGNTVVWLNADRINHDIVFDDGTPVGNLAPGQSSAPLTVVNPVKGYHCALHPTEVGQITIPAPVQLSVNITGSFGTGAFAPNPLQAATGNTVVWLNADLTNHDIVLDDGTPVGNLAPGQSSAPLTVVNPVTGYHCTLHPSMVGQITVAAPGEPPPFNSPQPPPADSGYAPPPPDPYGDGYEDGYYLKRLKK